MNDLERFMQELEQSENGIVVPALLWFLGVPGLIVIALWAFGVIG